MVRSLSGPILLTRGNMGFKIVSKSIRELLDKTTRKSIKYRKGSWPKRYRFQEVKKPDGSLKEARWFFIVKSDKEDSDPKGHKVRITLENPEEIPEILNDSELYKQDVKVTCTCPAFLYYGARYNAQEGGYLDPAPNQRGKVVPPLPSKKRNLICKHIAVSLPFALKFIRNYFKSRKGDSVPFL